MAEPTATQHAYSALPETTTLVARVLGELAGSASVCWVDVDGERVFDSQQASAFVHSALEMVCKLTRLGKPSLGCATSKELREELFARFDMGHTEDDYTTVGGQQ